MIELNDGFLDKNMRFLIEENKIKNKNEYVILYEFNRFLYKLLYALDGIELTDENKYIAASFVNVHKLYQAAIILLEHGFDTKFESILRQIIDLIVNILFVLKDKNNYKRILLKEYEEQIKLLKDIDKNKMYTFVPKEMLEQKMFEFEESAKELRQQGVKSCSDTKQLCKDIGIEELYVCYKYLCGYTHEGLGSVFQHTNNDNGNFFIDVNPKWGDINNDSARLINLIDVIIPDIIKQFNLDLNEEYNLFKEKFDKVYGV